MELSADDIATLWHRNYEKLKDENEDLRGLLREARDELNVIASYKDDTSATAGLRSTARAYDKLVMRIDAALKGGEEGGEAPTHVTYYDFETGTYKR